MMDLRLAEIRSHLEGTFLFKELSEEIVISLLKVGTVSLKCLYCWLK